MALQEGRQVLETASERGRLTDGDQMDQTGTGVIRSILKYRDESGLPDGPVPSRKEMVQKKLTFNLQGKAEQKQGNSVRYFNESDYEKPKQQSSKKDIMEVCREQIRVATNSSIIITSYAKKDDYNMHFKLYPDEDLPLVGIWNRLLKLEAKNV